MDIPHVCLKPSARQNKLDVGYLHLCRGCGTEWIVEMVDGKRAWVRLDESSKPAVSA